MNMQTSGGFGFEFEIKIGDWSDDGHGKCDSYRVKSNKPVKDAREAYFTAKAKLPPHLCPENFMRKYEDFSLPENVYTDAKERGFDFFAGWEGDERLTEEKLPEFLKYPQCDTERMCRYVIWFLKQGDSELELEMVPEVNSLSFYGFDEKKRHIGFIGYGLFH